MIVQETLACNGCTENCNTCWYVQEKSLAIYIMKVSEYYKQVNPELYNRYYKGR